MTVMAKEDAMALVCINQLDEKDVKVVDLENVQRDVPEARPFLQGLRDNEKSNGEITFVRKKDEELQDIVLDRLGEKIMVGVTGMALGALYGYLFP
ncbi:hypothetical protein B0T10DRAFT_565986 [Thelonectria olida]|uniref:Uncharacterized protein n=1 Tax=Thelonectria olida TaxID=1576542 RepID=A0A9P8VVB3_9HYPO|nr:hypothetical protein B0T10DRAFT_565986 [Thelonectria olida]